MGISIDAPYSKERLKTARQNSILHLERIVGNPEASTAGFVLQSRLVFTGDLSGSNPQLWSDNGHQPKLAESSFQLPACRPTAHNFRKQRNRL